MQQDQTINGNSGKYYTTKDYDDIGDSLNALKGRLVGLNAAEAARLQKEWLTTHRPCFQRSWKSIMTHSLPPAAQLSATQEGAITRARAARNQAEMEASFERHRARHKAEVATALRREKEKEMKEKEEELKALHKEVDAARATEAAAQKKASDADMSAKKLSAELDAQKDETLEANARAAAAELKCEEEKERANREKARADEAEEKKKGLAECLHMTQVGLKMCASANLFVAAF
ncbi:hypothetical protein EMVG_00063 [Emiliania huxleyi virus PS401]|nr:hypothetical protein EMVG_00063 [Emiliania huxleyi virus PS401]